MASDDETIDHKFITDIREVIHMKLNRILSVLLALMLLLTAGAAFAEEKTEPNLTKTAYLTKDFTYPSAYVTGIAATFKFEVEAVEGGDLKVQGDLPTIADISYVANVNGKQQSKVELPTYTEAGVYKYKITETANTVTDLDNGEVVYATNSYYMYVYVENTDDGAAVAAVSVKNIVIENQEGEKVDAGTEDSYGMIFTNAFNRNGGSKDTDQTGDESDKYALKVTKMTDKAPAGDQTDFSYTIIFTPYDGYVAGSTIKYAPEASGVDDWSGSGYTYTFSLKNSEALTLTGIPAGFTYRITETAAKNWAATASVVSNSGTAESFGASNDFNKALTVDGTIGEKHNTADFTNTYNEIPLTGVIINALPYVLMMVVAAGALALYVAAKRRRCAQEER